MVGKTRLLCVLLHSFIGLLPFAPVASASSWSAGSDLSVYGELSYKLFVPTNPRGPLIVALHGCHENPDLFANITRFNEIAESEGITVLYPEQPYYRNIDLCWNWFLPIDQVRVSGEPYMIAQATLNVAVRQHIDLSRVYVTGISSGAAMANILASCYSDLFAAVAIHSGLEYLASSNPFDAGYVVLHGGDVTPTQSGEAAFLCSGQVGRMMPAFMIHGTADPRVNPIMMNETFQQFTVFNDLLDDGKENASFPQIASQVLQYQPPAGYPFTVSNVDYQGKTFVRMVQVQGLPHAWSGGAPGYPNSDPMGPNATEMIWDFFSQFVR